MQARGQLLGRSHTGAHTSEQGFMPHLRQPLGMQRCLHSSLSCSSGSHSAGRADLPLHVVGIMDLSHSVARKNLAGMSGKADTLRGELHLLQQKQ